MEGETVSTFSGYHFAGVLVSWARNSPEFPVSSVIFVPSGLRQTAQLTPSHPDSGCLELTIRLGTADAEAAGLRQQGSGSPHHCLEQKGGLHRNT